MTGDFKISAQFSFSAGIYAQAEYQVRKEVCQEGKYMAAYE